jgi:hypothetical protein
MWQLLAAQKPKLNNTQALFCWQQPLTLLSAMSGLLCLCSLPRVGISSSLNLAAR